MTQPSILFWCGQSLEPWGPPSLETTGIGGSETACVHIARRFAQAGWKVDVVGSFDYYEGIYDGVAYIDPKRLPATPTYDVLISWRDPQAHALPIQAKARLVWCHDYLYGPEAAPHFARFDRVLGVSAWHARMLADAYDLTNVDHVPNGIDLERFDLPDVQKVPFQCVWSSSPDRDLNLMLSLWPRITAVEPAATLHVAYGWQGLDYRIRQGDVAALTLKQGLERQMETLAGVTWHGRLGQDALARLKCASWVTPYPTAFAEVSCISMMEAQAAGCVPVTSDTGALKDTVGEGGYVVPGSPYSKVTQDFFVRICHAVLGEVNARKVKEFAGKERAKGFTWDLAFERWLSVVDGVLHSEKVAEPVA